MADIHFEIFDNADFGNKNLRFSEAPAQEQRDFLKQNGYSFTSRYGGVWYPRTQSAKDRNADFVKEFAEKFYPGNNKFQSQKQVDHLAERALENSSAEIKSSSDDRIAYLENLIAELKEERKRDLEKISRLEAALENQTEENSEELEMRQEQAALDDEAEWEKENTLTDAEEKAYIERQFETEIPSETIELTSEMLDTLHESAEKEALAEEPQAEKEILHAAEKSDDDLTVSPEDLAIAKSVLPAVQYVSTLKFAQGEEREFFVHKIKEISAAVEKAPRMNETDGLEEHRIVLRYFHPSGTQSFVTEIGKDGEAFGFQCLNDDWENAEWGYLNLDELKNIRGMEVDFHVPAGMTVEKFIQKERADSFSYNDNFPESEMLEEDSYINSDEFISKFGDWNKANRLEKLRKSDPIEKDEKIILSGNDITSTVESLIENEDRKGLQSLEKEIGRTILGTYKNDDTGIFVNVSNRNVTEISNHHYLFKEHVQSLAYIPEIIEKATFIAEVENEDKERHPNIEKYLYFGTGLKLSGEDYTCKSVIGVDSSKNCYYDQSLSTIEKGKLVDYVMQNKKAGNLSLLITQRETDLEGNEMPYVYHDKRLISVCQVPQLSYMEKVNGEWKPTKEAIELVKTGRLHIEKNGQEYAMIEMDNEKPVAELSAEEVSRLSEEKYGFYFEYSDDENVADIYSAKNGDFVGSYGEGGFGYADDLSGNDPTTKIPDENFREVLELAENFYHKKSDEYENLVEAENGRMMNPAEAYEWNDEQKMQHSQEEDERDAEKADKNFEITKRLDEIVSEIKKSDFTLESKYENSLHSVALKNKDGKYLYQKREINLADYAPSSVHEIASANDEASEKAKSLADEFFNLVCDDGIRGGDYVNAVFKREVPVEEDYETDLSESNISYTAENYYQVNEHFAIEIIPADSPLSSGKMGDDWTVRFYDIDYTEKFGEKGQFVTSYYASSILEHGKGAGLSLQGDVPAWTLDAETMDYVHDITFMWVDRHSSVQQNEDTEISREEVEQEKQSIQKKIQQLKDELNNPENAEGGLYHDEQQNSDVRKNIENLEALTDEDIKNQILWKRENQKKNDETHSHVVEQVLEEKLRNEIPQEGELLSYNEKNPAYSVANKETKRETSIRPNGNPAENVKKLGSLKNISEANEIIGKIKSSGVDILSTESRIIIFDENKYYDFNAHADSGYFNYETKKFEFDLDKRNLNEWDFREYIKNGLKITKRMKDFAKIERTQNKKDYSLEEYWRNSASGMTMQDVKDGRVHIIDLTQKGTENTSSNLQSQDIFAPRTKSSQKKIREQCREILKKTDSEITEEDKKILAQYEGGGGLNEEERTNAEVLNAFYTPDNLIEKVWSLVDAYAPDAKSVLEPSAGVGRFAENRPDNEFTMHELDETSARINKILHPEADVIQGAFQKQFLDDGERFLKIGYEQPKHDVVIGNPPYGKYNDKYKGLGEGREFDRYEEYFIARGLDALKDEKSVLAFVVPSGFLNTADDKQKEIIASKGEILDAYRLPEGTFSTTEVGTDILIMRKKESLDGKNISSELLSNGEWFKNHPEKILGEVKTRTNRFGKEEEYVSVHEGFSVQDELNKIDSFVEKITEKNKSKNLFETQLAEYNKKYWGAVGQEDTRYDVSPVTEERLSEIKHLGKELSEYFENGIRPENDRFVIGKTPRVLQETGSEYTDVTVSVAVIKKAVETHGLSEEEILNALTRLSTPILVFDSDKAATENKADSKLVLTDVFKDEKPVALAVNVNDSVQKQENGHRKQVEVQNIRSIHDRTVVAKNGVDLIQKWTTDGLCRYVDDKKITDWSTIARVQFPIEVLQSADSNILTRSALVNSVFPEQTQLKENKKTEPEKQNSTSSGTKKERWNISKSKGEVMSAEEFSHLYGRNFDEREFPIWKATDWEGNIDLAKLSGDDIRYLSESGKYVEKNIGEWTHKELFASGDIYAKIQEQKELYEKSNGNKIFADNIKILESAMKSPLEMERIHFGVKTALAESFTIEHIDAERNKVNLNLQESFILWAQNARLSDQKWRGDIDFATANISREELGEELSFYDIVNYIDGKPVKAEPVRGWRTYDMSEEEKAAEKAERRKEADLKRQARSDTANRLFDRYLHEGLSDADKARLAAEYNRRFNSYVTPDYSKLPLFVDGMSAYKGDSKFKLYDQQIKGISFLCNKGNGLLAYDVGVGKTAAGIVATVNQIQTGRSRRPLIVVPNQVYSKWYTDIRQLFPNVKLNDLYNFGKDSVEKYIDPENLHRLNIPENSISLCTYEALKNITFTDESCENELYEDFASLLSADMDGSARENAESSDKIKGVIGSASHVKDESYFFYEDCGFDNLTVDEAHNFKNLWVVPRPKKKGESNEYAGIPSGKPSARALKMYGMTQLTQRHNDDRNVFMLTATPFTNSPTEVYSMLSYIGRERLRQAGITSLRAFFDEFAQTKQEVGVTSAGNIDTKQVMKNWKELSALQNILTEFIDKVDGEEAGIIRPNKFTHVKPLDMSDLQKQMRAIDEERMAEVKEGNSAAVIVAMNNMRLSCVAPALANPAMYPGVELPPLSRLVETSPKLKFVCDAIIDMYKGNPEKGQFMYVPLGKESHGIIKDYLVAHGIPKNAVEIINGEVNNTPEKKEKITSCFNDEKNPCKIIIGGRNTAEGIDLNGNSFVMYNCSLGWNPSETIQAEGRIWRQGNLQGNVHIVYPVMNDSIDSVLYQKHDEKRSRINELWNYKGDSLNVEDINPEDLKLDLIKDPNKKAKLILQEETKEARAELSRLNLKIKSFDEIIEKRKQLEFDFSNAKETVDYQKEQIESYKKSGLEVPEWIKSELKDCNKKFAKAETGLEKVREKLTSLKITDSEKEAEYIRNLNNQKHACEEKINNIEKTLPQILKKLEIERMEQKLIEYPVEKQREILEADIMNNLRPMKEVEYEIKTMRHEAMLSEKLKAGEISEKEFSLYKNAGYEKYEKLLNGEIESLEESSVKNEAANENSSIKNENDIEKIIVYYDGHWAAERGEKGKGWKYQEKSFDNPKDALDFYNTAKIPKDVGAENKNGFRFNFMNPEEQLLKMISGQDKTESVQKENVSEKTAAEKPEQKDLKMPEQNMDSLYAEPGSLFFGLGGSDVLSVHSLENGYRKSVPYDDFSITERQLTESELKRDEIIFPVLNGKESGMYKSFKDFAEHGVFDVQGKSVELDGSGRISEIGWNQLQAAMEIYRNKKFETFRYVLIGREDGKIKDQLAVKSYSPNSCAVSAPDSRTIKQVITRAEELDCMIAAVHNHPSGNTLESSFDVDTTEALRKICTKENGQSRFAGHIILDHDTFNLYTPQNGWKLKLNSNAYGNSEDKLLNKNFAFSEDSVDYTWQLENVAKKINDRNSWNDNFIPVVFADSLNHVSGIKLYDKSFFDNEPQKIRNELQFSGLEANSVKAFPVITKNFAETMSAVDELLFEDKLKNLVEHSAFIDAALPESTVTEKFNILPGRQYFDVHGAKLKNPDIEATWQTRINPALFSEPEQKTMRKKEVAFER